MSTAVTYDPLLVVLSFAIAIQASYVGLRLTIMVPDAGSFRRRVLLVGASLSLAMGIWGMHFVGMLAAHLPVGVQYEVLPTLLSFLLCVLVVGFAIVGASLWRKTATTLAVTSTVMGGGIVTMHDVGMAALHGSLHMAHDPLLVIASIAAAITASAAALWLATMAQRRPALILCAVLLGLAISSMHYIAMAGTTLHAIDSTVPATTPSLSSGPMAIVVAVVAFLISAGFFLALVPEPKTAATESRQDQPGAASFARGSDLAARSHQQLSRSTPDTAVEAVPERSPKPVPVERDGIRLMLQPNEIYAVRANAHYCTVYNGHEDLFCSLSISDVEAALNGDPFVRVHRSHIVNLERIVLVRKTADGGFADLAGRPGVSIPISRSKINDLRTAFDIRRSSAPHLVD